MPATSVENVLDEIVLRLRRITTGNGFNYTIPNNTVNVSWQDFLHWNKVTHFPAAFVLRGEASYTGGQIGGQQRDRLPGMVWGYVKATSGVLSIAERFTADIIKALATNRSTLLTDLSLAGLVAHMNLDGHDIVGDISTDLRICLVNFSLVFDRAIATL